MVHPVTEEKPQIRTEFDVYKNKYTFVQSEISEDGKNLVEIYQGPNNEILRSKAFLAGPDRWIKQEETVVEEDGTVLSLERFEPKCGFPCYKMENAKDGTIRTTITRYPKGMSATVPWLEKDRHVTVYEQSPHGEITTTMTQYHDHHNYDETVITPDKTETTVIVRFGDEISETVKTKNKTVTTKYERGHTDRGEIIMDADPSRKASETVIEGDHTTTTEWQQGVLIRKMEESGFTYGNERHLESKTYFADGKTVKSFFHQGPNSYLKEEYDEQGNILYQETRDKNGILTTQRTFTPEGCLETITEETDRKLKKTENKYIKDETIKDDTPGRLIYTREKPNIWETSEKWYSTTGKPGRIEKEQSSSYDYRNSTWIESTRVYSPDEKLSWESTVSEKGLTQIYYDEKGNIRFTITQSPKKDITLRYNREGKLETIVLKDEKGKGHVSQGIMARLKASARKKPTVLPPRKREYEG